MGIQVAAPCAGRQLYSGHATRPRHSLPESSKQVQHLWRTSGARHGTVLQRGTSTSRRARGRQRQHPQALFTGMRHTVHVDPVVILGPFLPLYRFAGHHAGIVQGQGHVTKVHQQQDFRSVVIEFPRGAMAGIHLGASVAINGTCLTVLSTCAPLTRLL